MRAGLFGASSLGRQCLGVIRGQAGVEAVCFFDNDPAKWNSTVDGLRVLEPTPAALAGVDVIWLTTAWADAVAAQIARVAPGVRVARTFAEITGDTRPVRPSTPLPPMLPSVPAPASSRTPAQDAAVPRAPRPGDPGRVTIVLADEGWILERCARELERRLPYVRVARGADPHADVNYYVNYAAHRGPVGRRQAAFFTHVEERAPEAATRFFDVARQVHASVAMSARYARQLREAGVQDVRVITPGVDLDRFQPRVRIGVVGRTYHTGRKGEALVRAVMDEPGLEWHFTGDGWPGPAERIPDAELPAFYRSMDYILVPALYEGGPMPVLEALASGVEVIAPDVGFVEDYPHLAFETGDADDLRRVLRGLVESRLARRRAVESRTWQAWADAHDTLFRELAAGAAGVTVATPSGATTSAATVAAAAVGSPAATGGTLTTPMADRPRDPSEPLRVLFALHAPESVVPVGGPSIRLPLMQQALARHGVIADIAREELPDPRGYDLVHVFNVWEPSAALRQLQHLRQFDVPVVFSPIFLSLAEGLWAQRAVLPVFRQRLDDDTLRASIMRLSATPRDVREAAGLALDASWEEWPARVRELTALADHLIVLSGHEAAALHRIGALGPHWSLVHNGVDAAWAEGASPEPFRRRLGLSDYVLSVGRLEPRKNQLLLARALRDTDLDLVLVGDVPKPDYADLVRRHGGRVHLVGRLGHDDDLLRSAFAGARLFALPSWSEGAPLSALEAAAFGLPLVLSDRSGEREYFGALGRYVDPLDLDGIRDAVMQAWVESGDAAARRDASRAWIDRALTWDHHARETVAAYARAIETRRGAPVVAAGFAPAPRRLEIGSGMNPQPGYEHLDARPDLPDIDHVADIRQPLPFPDGAFDEVMSRSCIEHVSWREVKGVLAEWGRVLKPGGTLDVWSPDFEYLCRRYLARQHDPHLDPALAAEAREFLGGFDSAAWAIVKMFGGQDYPENFHGAVLDEEVLTRVLHAAGFSHVERHAPSYGLRLKARRMPAFQIEAEAQAAAGRAAAGELVPEPTPEPQVPSVLWDSPVFNYGGYAALTRHVLRGLVPAGVPLQLRPRDDDEAMREACLASPAEGWLWSRALRRRVSGGAYVCCYTPADREGRSVFQARRDEHRGLQTYVGLTMFETDRLPAGWREACEAFDEIWVPSRFNRDTFTRAGVPADRIQVMPIGLDARRYDPSRVTPLDIPGRRGFVFLSVFDWSLRKGWDVLLRAYAEAFSSDDDVTLVLRTAVRGSGPGAAVQVRQFMAGLGDEATRPHVIVLEDPIADDEMPRLYRAADAFVLPTRGEGWGLPIMEAMASALPAIVTRWGAHLEFADDETAYLIDTPGTVPVDEAMTRRSPFYGPDHQWADPSTGHLATLMRRVFEAPDEARARGARAREHIAAAWTPERTAAWTLRRLTALAPDPSAAMDAAREAERAGRLDEAETQYARAAQLRPGWLVPIYNRASVLKRQRRRASAAALFERVARQGETPAMRAGASFHLGEIAFEDGRLDDAQAAFAACLDAQPDHRRARAWRAFIRGREQEQAGSLEPAIEAYRAARELVPDWTLAAYNLASALRRTGDTGEARPLFAELCRTAPTPRCAAARTITWPPSTTPRAAPPRRSGTPSRA
ncbi:MAG: glycosyltransferase [Vicinamibacterales bacterium]